MGVTGRGVAGEVTTRWRRLRDAGSPGATSRSDSCRVEGVRCSAARCAPRVLAPPRLGVSLLNTVVDHALTASKMPTPPDPSMERKMLVAATGKSYPPPVSYAPGLPTRPACRIPPPPVSLEPRLSEPRTAARQPAGCTGTRRTADASHAPILLPSFLSSPRSLSVPLNAPFLSSLSPPCS
eukprot:scaffold16996_cov101-Isochrysis_galbana.AAC.5